MFTTAILLAAGKGLRFSGFRKSKLLVKINYQPLIIYSLRALSRHPAVKEIIVAVNDENEASITRAIKSYNIKKVTCVLKGGERRQDSLGCCLKAVNIRSNLLLIHDAARPFINRKIITDTINAGRKSKAAVSGVPVKATIKIANRLSHIAYGKSKKPKSIFVKKTLDRDKLWQIQTPQVFEKDLLMEAYRRFGKDKVTDDASLVEKMGKRVCLVMGSYFNIKVTTYEDMVFAQAIAKGKWNTK